MRNKLALKSTILCFLSVLSANLYADDNVCVINNSSLATKFSAGDGDHPDFNIPAKGGDQNKCWGFGTGVGEAGYPIFISFSQYPNDEIHFDFTNPMFGSGYFKHDYYSDDWPPNTKICTDHACVWHTGKTDVWRVFVEDK